MHTALPQCRARQHRPPLIQAVAARIRFHARLSLNMGPGARLLQRARSGGLHGQWGPQAARLDHGGLHAVAAGQLPQQPGRAGHHCGVAQPRAHHLPPAPAAVLWAVPAGIFPGYFGIFLDSSLPIKPSTKLAELMIWPAGKARCGADQACRAGGLPCVKGSAHLQAGLHAAGVSKLHADVLVHGQALDGAARGRDDLGRGAGAPQHGQQRQRRALLGQRAPVLERPGRARARARSGRIDGRALTLAH